MKDYLNIGSVPVDEECTPLLSGQDNIFAMRKECLAFKHQLQRLWPSGIFTIKRFEHDFGTYYEVVAWFDTDMSEDDPVNAAAYAAEANTPERWDSEALKELA